MCFRSQSLKASSDTRNNRDIKKRYHDGSPMTAFVTGKSKLRHLMGPPIQQLTWFTKKGNN